MGKNRARAEFIVRVRYVCDGHTIGYHLANVHNGKGDFKSVEATKVLAASAKIANCTAYMQGDQAVLRGVGCSLEDLPVKTIPSWTVIKAVGKDAFMAKREDGKEAVLGRGQLLSNAKRGAISNIGVDTNETGEILFEKNTDLERIGRETINQSNLSDDFNTCTVAESICNEVKKKFPDAIVEVGPVSEDDPRHSGNFSMLEKTYKVKMRIVYRRIVFKAVCYVDADRIFTGDKYIIQGVRIDTKAECIESSCRAVTKSVPVTCEFLFSYVDDIDMFCEENMRNH